jgi:hypothetical protein
MPSLPAADPADDRRGALRWGALLSLLAFLTAASPLDDLPHVTDEVSYTLQARLFAQGLRVGPPAEDPSRLLYPFWVSAPVSHSPFPPGWPALLALGEALGAGLLVNPLLAFFLPGLAGQLGGALGLDTAGRRLCQAAMALSPGVWVLAASRMAHTSVLLALGLCALALLRRPAWLGLPLAYVVLARPFDALLIGGPLLLVGLVRAPRAAPAMLGPPLVAAGLLGLDNLALTGSPWTFPMDPWFDQWIDPPALPGCNRLGFGEDRGCAAILGSVNHSPEKALRLMGDSLLRLDRLLLGLPGFGLLALAGALRLRRAAPFLLLGLLLGGYALYWSPGMAYGARFYHPAYLLLPACLAAALAPLGPRLGLAALALPVMISIGPIWRDLGSGYWCVDGEVRDLLAANGIVEGTVFVGASGSVDRAWPALGVEAFTCDPTLEAGDAFALADPGPAARLRLRYAPPNGEAARAWLSAHPPASPAWVLLQDLSAGGPRRLQRVDRADPP